MQREAPVSSVSDQTGFTSRQTDPDSQLCPLFILAVSVNLTCIIRAYNEDAESDDSMRAVAGFISECCTAHMCRWIKWFCSLKEVREREVWVSGLLPP